MSLDLDKLRALFDLLAEKEIAEFEHEEEGVRVRVSRAGGNAPSSLFVPPYPSPVAHSIVPPAAGPVDAPATASKVVDDDTVDVTSPFVGSFFRAPSPEAPPFVEVGSVVRTGQTLCIIEAMKLMNEIEAECAGTVVEIFAQNGKSIEYGQKLFRIKKA
ncbi:MAG: acetyl-CoA carboxylase biotin carboxyl carrier protein [Polyangiaceae bacterium]|jgi:acetyl-CoA carboxylase biotin carboxyl carrier protein